MIALEWDGVEDDSAVFRVVEYNEFTSEVVDSFELQRRPYDSMGQMLAYDGNNPITSFLDSGLGKYEIILHDRWTDNKQNSFIYPTTDVPLGADWYNGNLYITDSGGNLYGFLGISHNVLAGFPLDMSSVASPNAGVYGSIWISEAGNLHGVLVTPTPGQLGKVVEFRGITTEVISSFSLKAISPFSWGDGNGLIRDDSGNIITVQHPFTGEVAFGAAGQNFEKYDSNGTVLDSFVTTNRHYDLSRRIAEKVPTRPTAKKRYLYKVFDNAKTNWDEAIWDESVWDGAGGNIIATWSDEVISKPSFVEGINSSPGELRIRLAREFSNFGEGVDVELKNKVEVYCYDTDNSTGLLVYAGYISKYTPTYADQRQFVDIVLLPFATELANYILEDGNGDTTVAYLSQDPSDILKDIIDKYRDLGGTIDYTATSIETTGTTVTYTFKNATVRDALEKVVELSPDNWYSFISANNVITFKQHKSETETADHELNIGRHLAKVRATQDVELIINKIYFVGGDTGGGDQLYLKDTRQGSIDGYGLQAHKIADARVTVQATAEAMMSRILDDKQAPIQMFEIQVVDSNGDDTDLGYDIESIDIGETIAVLGLFARDVDITRWDVARWDVDFWDAPRSYNLTRPQVVVSKRYSKNFLEIQVADKVPLVAKRIEDINRNLDVEQSLNIPTGPTSV